MKFREYMVELLFGAAGDYEKTANWYVGTYGKEAKKEYMKSQQGSGKAAEEAKREVFKYIDKLYKKLGV